MGLRYNKLHDAKLIDSIIDSIDFIPHKNDPRYRYDDHHTENSEPIDLLTSAQNLFDDSNQEDKKYLLKVRAYISGRHTIHTSNIALQSREILKLTDVK